jgi:hypothetical protein
MRKWKVGFLIDFKYGLCSMQFTIASLFCRTFYTFRSNPHYNQCTPDFYDCHLRFLDAIHRIFALSLELKE